MKINESGANPVRPLQRALDEAVAAYRRGDSAVTTRTLRRSRAGAKEITRTAREAGHKSWRSELSSSAGS